jgi:hypothetical protein
MTGSERSLSPNPMDHGGDHPLLRMHGDQEPLHHGKDAFHGVHSCVTHSKSSWTAWEASLPAYS